MIQEQKTSIKAVPLVRQIRDKHYEMLRGKSTAERIAFYRAASEKLHSQLAQRFQVH